jgi:hypothetical protein
MGARIVHFISIINFANRVILFLFNLDSSQTLTDIETCYKMMTREVARSLRLTVNDFGIEVEMSAEIARQRCCASMRSASAITAGPTRKARRSTGRTG